MMPGNLFRLQIMEGLADRRQMILRIGISLLLALPFVCIAMPSRAQAAGIVMVVLFTGFFGAAVSHAHLRSDGRFTRLSLLPVSRWVLWHDLVLSSMLMRLGPSLVVLAGFIAVSGRGTGPVALLNLAGLLCAALLLLTVLGMGVGRLARNNAEVHLFGALATGGLALLSGIVPLPDRLAWLGAITAWNPVARLLAALAESASGPTAAPMTEIAFSSIALVAVLAATIVRWCALTIADSGLNEARATIPNPQSAIRNS